MNDWPEEVGVSCKLYDNAEIERGIEVATERLSQWAMSQGAVLLYRRIFVTRPANYCPGNLGVSYFVWRPT